MASSTINNGIRVLQLRSTSRSSTQLASFEAAQAPRRFHELALSSTGPQGERRMQRLHICCSGNKQSKRRSQSREASADGIRKRMSKRDIDQEGWIEVTNTDDLIEGKNKAIIHDKNGYVIVKRDAQLYTIKANCTSCQFPLVDGKVEAGAKNDKTQEDETTINCPLCHSKFSLTDGKVVVWCPKDGVLQWMVGSLKEKAPQLPAKVYPTRQSNSGRVYVKLVGASELRIS